jgi:hypothetical protein
MPALPTAAKGTHEQDLLVVNNILKEDFTVNWGGQPFTIKEGERKIFPRFIAEHMAKHMADRALLLEEKAIEDKTGKKLTYSILNNAEKRTKAVGGILTAVYQYYLQQPKQTDAQKVAQTVEEANKDVDLDKKASDVGEVPSNRALGVLSDKPLPKEKSEPPKPLEGQTPQQVVNSETSLTDKTKPKPTKDQLVADCEKLGIELNGNESYDELVAKIKAF